MTQHTVLRKVSLCRTAALGGHLDQCPCCGHERPSYNSCGDRHCPTCQALPQGMWAEQRMQRALPTHYFHTTFTVPDELRPLIARNRGVLYNVLFGAASETLQRLGEQRLGVRLGVTAVLHSWDRKMLFHPHVHCMVTGGGLTLDDACCKATKTNYLFPVAVMRAIYAGIFVDRLAGLYAYGRLDLGGRCARLASPQDWDRLVRRLRRRKWVIDVRPPVAGPQGMHRYLSEYTHRVAISDHRLLSVSDTRVRFRTRDDGVQEVTPQQFIRRFLLHVLPPGFHKIRHYGLYAACNVHTRLRRAASLLGQQRPDKSAPKEEVAELRARVLARLLGRSPHACPKCGGTSLVRAQLPPTRHHPPPWRPLLPRMDSS